MSQISNNPFLEDSEPVPDEEVAAAAKALAEEAALIRSRADEIKEKAAKAKAQKEAARKAELARIEAEVAAARAQVIKTVASIPKASERLIRPAPPPKTEDSVLGSGEVVASGSGKFFSSDNLLGMLSLTSDLVIALIAVTFTFLIFKDM